jgi:DNA repair exonuclease SbcCD nuclease subunit
MAERMTEERVDICLFAGDAFKDARVLLDRARVEIEAFLNWLNYLSDHDIPTIVISGTPSHDAVAAYELLRNFKIRNCDIVTAPSLIALPYVNIACIPGMNRSNIMTRDECRDMDIREVHGVMSRTITDIAQGLRSSIDNARPAVLLSHLTYSEAETGFDHLLLEHEPLLTPEAVQNFDLVCLGHIHRAQRCANRKVFYAGSPERLSFNEEDCDPGFWIHVVPEPGDKDTLGSWFVPTPARRYVTVREDVGAMSHDRCPDVRDAVVRFALKTDEETAKSLSRKDIERYLYENGAYFVQEIKIEAERAERARDRNVTESLGPVEALSKWCARQGIEDENAGALASLTQELLEEVA